MSNKITINVGGMKYSISSDENENYMKALGSELERKLDYNIRRNPNLSTTLSAIITALESMDNEKKARAEIERLNSEISRLSDELSAVKSEKKEGK